MKKNGKRNLDAQTDKENPKPIKNSFPSSLKTQLKHDK